MRLFDAGARGEGPPTVHDRVWTAANAITFVRLAGLPLFVWLMLGPGAHGAAAALLATIAATDWVDGYVARRFDQVTKLGRFLDPLIDRLLLAVVAVTLLILGWIPVWLVALVVVRDVVLVGASFVAFRGPPSIPVSRLGKFATACLLVGVPSFLAAGMDWSGAGVLRLVAFAFSLVGVAAYYASAVDYARQLRRLRAEGRTPVTSA